MHRARTAMGHRGKRAVQHFAQFLGVGDGFQMAQGLHHRALIRQFVQPAQSLAQRVAATKARDDQFPTMGLATVYATLNVMVERRLLRPLAFENAVRFFA